MEVLTAVADTATVLVAIVFLAEWLRQKLR